LGDTTYLHPRRGKGRSGTRWYVRVPIPKDLQHVLHKRIVEVALNTDSVKDAQKKRFPVVSKIFADFELARSKKITSAHIEEEARAYCEKRLAEYQRDPSNFNEPVHDEFGGLIGLNGDIAVSTIIELIEDENNTAPIQALARKTDEDRRLKNDNSVRPVPVHPELLRIGFKQYLTHITKQGEEYLFPALKPGSLDNRRGHYISKKFTAYRRKLGLTDPTATLHSTRKNATSALRRAGIQESEAALVIGHEHGNITYGTYAPELDLAERKRVIEKIEYPTISLDWLYDRLIIGLPRAQSQGESHPT
jgi:hypothetical protein